MPWQAPNESAKNDFDKFMLISGAETNAAEIVAHKATIMNSFFISFFLGCS